MTARLERVAQERAEAVLGNVLHFRDNYARFEKPDDVNALLELFSGVHVRSGYVLDYDLVQEGKAMIRIRPFARRAESEEAVFSVEEPSDQEGHGEQAVETLYQYLSYDKTPVGLFEYVFLVQELWSTRASWHEAEWLASTPIFTQRRFDEIIHSARKVEDLKTPDWCGPEALVDAEGGRVRFLVHTPMGWERIYWLEVSVEADGRLDVHAGDIVADLGQGENF
ncbi:MAG: hypothetical protein ACKVJG_19115 [Candidatus Latescibacterota bacterium]|jgi:hypothetical protein|tara:strand:+ start:572 stop:1243 length:672 start_codon:yes stop_codon:yes gene_type:complete